MFDITLVFTHHGELGKCNSDELYTIIEYINPDVIFEELPPDLFNRVYTENEVSNEPPEIASVKRYLRAHNTNHIPVDIDLSTSLSTDEIDYVFTSFKKYNVYKDLEDEQYKLTIQNGYAFLNSKRCEELFIQKIIMEQSLLQFMMDKDRLSRIRKSFYEEQHVREHEIIKNIYKYSKQKPYNRGLLLIGSGHRKTIIEKIETYKTREDLKLNWVLYSA